MVINIFNSLVFTGSRAVLDKNL